MKKLFVFLMFLLFPCISIAKDRIEIYKEKYKVEFIKRMAPKMTVLLGIRGKKRHEIKEIISKVSDGMAVCQVEVLASFDKKYSNAAISLAASGASMIESNRKIEMMMNNDIADGKTTKARIQAQMDAASQKLRVCAKKVMAAVK